MPVGGEHTAVFFTAIAVAEKRRFRRQESRIAAFF